MYTGVKLSFEVLQPAVILQSENNLVDGVSFATADTTEDYNVVGRTAMKPPSHTTVRITYGRGIQC